MILFFILFQSLSFAHIIQDDVATTERNRFAFRAVCDKMVTHEAPLIEIVSGTELDCMGRKINVGTFCDKEMVTDPYYLRAYIDKEKKEVVCHSGKKVIFKLLCAQLENKHYCEQKAQTSCQDIQEKLAKRLDLVEFSIIKNNKGIKQLNCDFASLPRYDRL